MRAGNYLIAHGEEEPEIARGSFSRDRFDSWAADRLEATYDAPHSASSQYVGEDYSSDVAVARRLRQLGLQLDLSTQRLAAAASPRAGRPTPTASWYYTPAGLTWWSCDSWGWYPFHYGNWFFDSGWNSWCWSPGYVYSPAWVYWGYTSGYVGWCPIGNYGGYNSPWWNNYYRNWNYPPEQPRFAINGNYSTRRVDMRGWNFTGANGFGTTRGRVDVVPGTRVADRLGGQIAVSSRPIVVTRAHRSRRPRVACATTSGRRRASSSARPAATPTRLEPVLARDRELPPRDGRRAARTAPSSPSAAG